MNPPSFETNLGLSATNRRNSATPSTAPIVRRLQINYGDVVVFCDESGAKGYADQSEKEPGEIGIFAGFAIPRDDLSRLADEFKNELSEFRDGTGKVHITDLSPDKQERLRQKVYSVLLRRRVPCFYEAIHVEGFHRAHRLRCEHIEDVAVKRGAKRKKEPSPESLHDYLFQGFYGRVLAYCSALGIANMIVEIRTDKVDPPILKRFHSKAKALLSDTIVREVKRWDPKTSTVNKESITVKFQGPRPPITVEDCIIRPDPKDSDLVLAGDVLANSLYYQLRLRPADKKFGPLNIKALVLTHPLERLLVVRRSEAAPDFADIFFAHPLNPALSKTRPQKGPKNVRIRSE